MENVLEMIDKSEYKLMEFDPTIKAGTLFSKYPKLRDIVGDVDEKLVRYALLMYDKNSPVRKFYPEIGIRKDFCAEIAGYDFDKESDEIDSLKSLTKLKEEEEDDWEDLEGSGDKKKKKKVKVVVPYDELLDIISAILRYQNSRVWTMISTNEQSFYEYQESVS